MFITFIDVEGNVHVLNTGGMVRINLYIIFCVVVLQWVPVLYSPPVQLLSCSTASIPEGSIFNVLIVSPLFPIFCSSVPELDKIYQFFKISINRFWYVLLTCCTKF